MRTGCRRVLIVGGGAAGTITATALLRDAVEPLEVRIVETRGRVGRGLAYGTSNPVHLLNNYVARMSAIDDDPAHLLRWCHARGHLVTPHSFISRDLYGSYLEDLLDDAPMAPDRRLVRQRGEVVAIADLGNAYVATLASGEQIGTDEVVLALGNPPPRDLPVHRGAARRYAPDPWAPELDARVARGDRVLLIGTGLTTVDVSVQLAAAHDDVEMVAVSRHGLLPLPHLEQPPAPTAPFSSDATTLGGLLREVRRHLQQTGPERWRELVESVKLSANGLWAGLSCEDQARFLRHVGRQWEVTRHRMAPAMADIVEGLLLDGRLRIAQPDEVAVDSFDLVVNCTGPAPACTPGWSPLVDTLTARGLARPGPHGLGLDVTPTGALVSRSGTPARGLHVVGAARRGAEWEVAAVPDLRRQATAVARVLAPTDPASSVLVG